MTIRTDLALQRKIEDYVDCRNRVLALIEHGMKALQEAEDLCRQFVPYGFPHEAKPHCDEETARKRLDGAFWAALLDRTGLTTLLDAEAMRAFRADLEHDRAPPFTLEEIQTQVITLHQSAGELFSRGVYNVFRRITRSYKRFRTNERHPFTVGRRNIVTGWFEPEWRGPGLHVRYEARDEVNDLDRIVSVLSGQPYTPRRLETALNQALKSGETNSYEDAQLHIRAFRNGNAHITFKDPVVLDKINQVIAEYCGNNALAEARDDAYGRPNDEKPS